MLFSCVFVFLAISAATSAAALPTPVALLENSTHDDDQKSVIIVIDGLTPQENTQDVDIISFDSNKHNNGAEAPVGLCWFGSTKANNTIYMLGGSNNSAQPVDSFFSYDIQANKWAKDLPKFPFGVMGNALVAFNNGEQLISLGGNTEPDWTRVDKSYVYDVQSTGGNWLPLAELPPGDVSCAVVADVSSSGFGAGKKAQKRFTDVDVKEAIFYLAFDRMYRSDDGANTWTEMATMNVGRAGPICISYSNVILVAGGNAEGHEVELYNIKDNTWTTRAPMLTERLYSAAALLPSAKALVCGGENVEDGAFDDCEEYDFGEDQWARSEFSLKSSLTHFGLFVGQV